MQKVTIVGKDWGFFASSLSQTLVLRGVAVTKRFASNVWLGASLGPSSTKLLRLARTSYKKINGFSLLSRLIRKTLEFVTLVWWTTGIIGSQVIVVSCVPTLFQSRILFSLSRRMGKQVVLCIHGSDGRPPFLNGLHRETFSSTNPVRLARYILKFRRTVKAAALRSTSVISWMGCSHFLPGAAYLFEEIGFPSPPPIPGIDSTILPEEETTGNPDRPLRFVHAPSSQGKGTFEIRRVIEELIEEAHPLSFEQLDDRPNIEVLAAIGNADVVIDQLYSDNFMGVLAREAASRSRWVVVGGDSLAQMKSVNWELPPVLTSSSERLREDLLWCLENRGLLAAKGKYLRRHLERVDFTDFFISTFLDPTSEGAASAQIKPKTPYLDFHPGFGGYGSKAELTEIFEAAVRAVGTGGLGFPSWFLDELVSHLQAKPQSD